MNDLKYVITDCNSFAIFTDSTKHSDIARALFGTPISAGFCRFTTPEIANGEMEDAPNIIISCSGESVSLDLKSRGRIDEDIINKKLNTNDY